MYVSGVADRVEVTSEPVSTAPDVYDLSWQVKSFSPVQEYKVAYRRSKVSPRVSCTNSLQQPHSAQPDAAVSSSANRTLKEKSTQTSGSIGAYLRTDSLKRVTHWAQT